MLRCDECGSICAEWPDGDVRCMKCWRETRARGPIPRPIVRTTTHPNAVPVCVGDRIGCLVVERIVEVDPRYGYVVECRCDCGGSVERIASQLRMAERRLSARGVRGPGCLRCALDRKEEAARAR